MGAALSISAVDALARAIKNHAPQRWLTAPHHGTTDWSGLPEDLLLTVMAELDVPSIIRSGAVCTSWHHAYETFRRLRLPSPKQAPCMFYSCDEYGPNYGALYCPSTNATFRVPFQRPLEQSRGFISSCCGSSVYTIDLNGPLPMVTMIMRGVSAWGNPTKYLAFSPSGELQQIWMIWNCAHVPIKEMVDEDGVDFANEYDDDKFSELFEDDYRFTTVKLFIFKVDIGRQKLVELQDIGDHALFLGYNNVVYVPTKDFPAFKPNHAYLADDRFKCKPTLKEDLGIWNVKERNMQKLQDAWPSMYSWLDLPAPIWITPRFLVTILY
ncbi:uncharacterized protein [Aegilops tauschii subsp. strangulata]|uniref:uncharacterized protein n=1 Tax=Aegilops tauschii subsp. strangulata TaxID=200361 RepID=UPI003CC8B0EB